MSTICRLLGERIKFLRYQRNLSQEQLALKAEINKSFMGQIERGEKSPTVKTLEKIVVALDITFVELFSFDNSANTHSDFSTIDKITYELNTHSAKEQEAAYKLVKSFFDIVDDN